MCDLLHENKNYTVCLVFRKKDLYLVITQRLTLMKSGGFRADFSEIWRISSEIWHISCGFHLKSTRFHEIRRISKDQLPGMVSPMLCRSCYVPWKVL